MTRQPARGKQWRHRMRLQQAWRRKLDTAGTGPHLRDKMIQRVDAGEVRFLVHPRNIPPLATP